MKNALLVIDVQKLYTEIENDYLVEDANTIVENINRIIDVFKKNNQEIIYIRHIHAKDGSDAGRMFDFAGESDEIEFLENSEEVEYASKLKVAEGCKHIIKHRYDSFEQTGLNEYLSQRNIEKVTIVGFMTNFCCESTARRAHDLDYFVDFVRDATGTPGVDSLSVEQVIEATCATLSAGFATIISTNEI